jgi:hypothetical protein
MPAAMHPSPPITMMATMDMPNIDSRCSCVIFSRSVLSVLRGVVVLGMIVTILTQCFRPNDLDSAASFICIRRRIADEHLFLLLHGCRQCLVSYLHSSPTAEDIAFLIVGESGDLAAVVGRFQAVWACGGTEVVPFPVVALSNP